MLIPEGGIASTSPALALDVDGDGTTDLTLVGNANGLTEEELTAILKGVIKTLNLPHNKEKKLLKKIDKLAKELAKEYKNEQSKKHKTKEVFKQLLKTIDRYEQKHIFTVDEAKELRIIVERIQGGGGFVAYTPALDISTSGKSGKEVKARFEEMASIFFEEITEAGTIKDVLTKLGWKKEQKKWAPPQVISAKSIGLRIPALV